MESFGVGIYEYCTDFMLNLAWLTGLSYYEVNAYLFVVLMPILTVLLVVMMVWQYIRYWKLLRKNA